MSAAPKVNGTTQSEALNTLVAALQPSIAAMIQQGIEDALTVIREQPIVDGEVMQPANLGEIVTDALDKASAKQKKARQDSKRRRKAQSSKELPAFPKGFVKGASFSWIKADGSETQHRIVSIEDGVAKTRGLTGFQGTWKSTTIIAALQTKSVKLLPKPSKKAA